LSEMNLNRHEDFSMQILSTNDASTASPANRVNERGAALISVLLFSVLLLAAGGALILSTSLSATNAIDTTAEAQAYYAAEAGMQSTLAVLRGNVAPNPLFDTSSPTAAANKISFRKAVTLAWSNSSTDGATVARLSRWLNYNVVTPSGAGIGLTSPYTAMSGMAYDTVVDDPDNTANITYSTLGAFGSDSPSSSPVTYQFGNGNPSVTVSYTPQASTQITDSGTTLGTFRITQMIGSPDISTNARSTFTITIRQVNATGTIDVPVICKLAVSGSNIIATFDGQSPTSNNIAGTTYVHAGSVTFGSTSVSIPVTITAGEPFRVRVTVNGYGPRGAKKQMHMLVSRFSFDFMANATITIRGADPTPTGTQMTSFSVGSSSPYGYSGFDTSGGPGVPAFVVTNDADYNLVNTTILGEPVKGVPAPARKAAVSELPLFLQTAQAARQALDSLRGMAQDSYWPAGTSGSSNDRYFPAGTTPSTFGTVTTPLMTFVDGDCALPPGGGAGLLIVTGVLDMRGSADFKGLILVLGAGQVLRNGGGSDTTLGAMDIARFGPTGDFLPPSFDSNGSGASQLDYDSKWLDKALASPGPGVRAVSEY
jgi:hypothetical protein